MDNLEKYKCLVENLPAVTWITDQAGNTVYISPSVEAVYGFSPAEILTAGPEIWIDRIHTLDLTRVLRAYGGLFSTGSPFDIVYRIQHKAGHWIWIHDRAQATFTDDGFEYAYGVFFDVTQQKETELALREQEKRFETLASRSTDWIWEFDEDGIFTYSSPRIKELLGYEPEEIVGKSAFDLIPADEVARVRAEFKSLKEARASFSSLTNINQHKDGHLISLESSGVPIIDEDGIFRGYRGIDRDISERRNLEAQLRHMQKMEAMGTLAGGIAHDFNNILAVLLGYAEMLKIDVAENDKGRRHLAEVVRAGQRAKNLVTQILSFSRVLEQEKYPLRLHQLVAEIERFLRATIPSTIEIVRQVDSEEDVILADPTQIHQVIMNLATNAAQAMNESGGRLTFRISTVQIDRTQSASVAPGNYVKLLVEDTGCGIAPEHVGRVFDPYFTTKPVGEGTGLGLSVVHGIVQSHDGAIRIINRPGRGTTFEVVFPQIDALPQQELVKSSVLATGSGHILYVDDERSLVALGAEMLSELGYRVTTETDSRAALELFCADPYNYDLVITDQTMPKLTGDQLTGKLLQLRPELPVILCTGFSSQINREQALAIGVRDFLQKPIEVAELSATVSRALSLKAAD